jgi:hypothetical protein
MAASLGINCEKSPASKDVITKVKGSTALKAVIRQRLEKTQQTEKTQYVL